MIAASKKQGSHKVSLSAWTMICTISQKNAKGKRRAGRSGLVGCGRPALIGTGKVLDGGSWSERHIGETRRLLCRVTTGNLSGRVRAELVVGTLPWTVEYHLSVIYGLLLSSEPYQSPHAAATCAACDQSLSSHGDAYAADEDWWSTSISAAGTASPCRCENFYFLLPVATTVMAAFSCCAKPGQLIRCSWCAVPVRWLLFSALFLLFCEVSASDGLFSGSELLNKAPVNFCRVSTCLLNYHYLVTANISSKTLLTSRTSSVEMSCCENWHLYSFFELSPIRLFKLERKTLSNGILNGRMLPRYRLVGCQVVIPVTITGGPQALETPGGWSQLGCYWRGLAS